MTDTPNGDFKTAVHVSTNEDPFDAGKQVAYSILKKLGKSPDILFLFCTGHYEKNKGHHKLLEGAWEVLPKETKLVGGNVAGFINNQGVFAQGVAGLGISYQNMNVSIGYGKNTRRNPAKAAKNCSEMLKNNLNGEHKNKILIPFVSGGEVPNFPGFKKTSIVKSKYFAGFMLSFLNFFQKVFQSGLDRGQEVLEELVNQFNDYNLICGETSNTQTFKTNHQFFNKEVFNNSIVCAALETDFDFKINSAHGVLKTNVNFKATQLSKNKLVIKKINNKPAFSELLNLMDLPEEKIDNEGWFTTSMKRPISYEKDGKIYLRPSFVVVGNLIGCIGRIDNENLFVGEVTQSSMVNSVKDVLKTENPDFGFLVSCISRQSFLGIKIYEIHDRLKAYFNESPFLLIYVAGEAIRKPNQNLDYFNETITSLIIGKE